MGRLQFEDAVIMSERLVKDDVYTSVHWKNTNQKLVDTKLGPKRLPAKFQT